MNLPIKSHHCKTTHTACECILDNMNKLEERVKELENRNEKVEHLYAESKDLIKELVEENRKLMILVKEIMGEK